MERFDVVVVGGGYAGVLAALRASAKLGRGRVALVSKEDSLVERTRLHEAVVRDVSIRTKLDALVGPTIEVIVDRVAQVERGRVTLASGETLTTKRVIVATGAPMIPRISGAHMLETETVDGLRAAIRGLPPEAPIAVIGGGLTGIELAGELAEAGRRTLLIGPRRLAPEDLSERGAAACEAALRELGVVRIEGRVREVAAGHVVLEDGTRLAAALAIATVGMAASGLAPKAAHPTLAATSDAHLYLAGDCGARAVGVRTGCKTAMPLGAHAGDNAARSILGEVERPFSWRYFGCCVSIGRARGVIDAQDDGGASTLLLTGRFGAWVKEQVLRYTLWSMHLERRGWFSYWWPEAKARTALPSEAS